MDLENIVIIGADSPLLREVARLAVAYGARVRAFLPIGRPDCDEPWVEGVTWPGSFAGAIPDETNAVIVLGATGATEERSPRRAAVGATAQPESDQAPTPLGAIPPGVKIVAGGGARVKDADVTVPPIAYEHGAIPPLNSTAGAEAPHPRVETLAMATLRAAIEPELRGDLSVERALELGDAMMWQ